MMVKREELQSLLERVERAEGADRELDASIAYVVGEEPGEGWELLTHSPGIVNMDAGRWVKGGLIRTPNLYTSSIDAALALVERVLPSWAWSIGHDGNDELFTSLWDGVDQYSGYATTPPLALLAALLEALISQSED